MDLSFALSVLVLVVGIILYALPLPTKPKVTEVGRLMFFAGMFVTLLHIGGRAALSIHG